MIVLLVTSVILDEYQNFCSDTTLSWICPVCQDNTHCDKCNTVFNPTSNQKSICCHYCKKYSHLKCSQLTLANYTFHLNLRAKWYCRTCTNYIFPFNSLDNNKFLNFLKQNTRIKKAIPAQDSAQDSAQAGPNCTVCLKNVNVNHTKIICPNCYHYIHKKCSKLKPNEITNMDWNWECHTCSQQKFPFVQASYEEIIHMSYNSNLNCPCVQHSINPPTDFKDSPFLDVDPYDNISTTMLTST